MYPADARVPAEAAGEADVSIPIEVTLDSGNARINVHLRLTLNLKLPK